MPLRSKKKILMSWSSGKDSAWALNLLRHDRDIDVVALLTTFNEEAGRVAMHGVRQRIVELQAHAAELPLIAVDLPYPCSNAEYEAAMSRALDNAVDRYDVEAVAFGDLHLEDVRGYREKQLSMTGLEPLFPLWGQPTDALAREMIEGGLRAIITCVDPKQMPAMFAGADFDAALLDSLPAGVDPCGENGEFHTVVTAGPVFEVPLDVVVGDTVERDGFVFADILPTVG
ncbi:MAG: adenine nucleotide alpha hydrolase [Chromatiales bacterium]|nr:adenine nucleotide alpha hydrolase [Chromatiales bacterium]MDH3931959.1 adenine nucleotide alpha hydrolase [Chromatiales bacterium]MDH4015486.1 adenine nucleotide alpha hydrolase [Chromatiales bacterium]